MPILKATKFTHIYLATPEANRTNK